MNFDTANPEAFDVDFEDYLDFMRECAKPHSLGVEAENNTKLLLEWAKDVREMDEDLAERLTLTAETNPLSESFFDLRDEVISVL